MDQWLAHLDPSLQLILLIGSLSLLPFAFVSMTSFLRYIIVFSILKTALGTQQVPPAIVLSGMALVLSLYTMAPVFNECYQRAEPLIQKKASVVAVLDEGVEPLKAFMMRQTRQSDAAFFVELSKANHPKSPKTLPFGRLPRPMS
jgi:flagellar biosynthetic protein FliP